MPPVNFYLKVLFVYRSDVDTHGGTVRVMEETAKALEKKGVAVELTHDLYPDASDHDLVHVFNLWKPRTALAQLKHLRKGGSPIVWSPFFQDWGEYAWASPSVQLMYARESSPEKKREILDVFAQGEQEVQGQPRSKPDEARTEFRKTLLEMLSLVDHACVASWHEIKGLSQFAELPEIPFTLTPHGVDAGWIRQAPPGLFSSLYSVKDFILCVGAVERRKNQLMLIEALKETGLQIVLIGPPREPDYLELCLKEGGKRVFFADRLSEDLVASAYKDAAVHALPSFAEGAALTNLEAAVAECPMAVSNRASELEYLGDAPFYCSPNDLASIHKAVMLALDTCWTGRARWKKLGKDVEERFSWDRTAESTVKAYERVLGGGFGRKKKQAGASRSQEQ